MTEARLDRQADADRRVAPALALRRDRSRDLEDAIDRQDLDSRVAMHSPRDRHRHDAQRIPGDRIEVIAVAAVSDVLDAAESGEDPIAEAYRQGAIVRRGHLDRADLDVASAVDRVGPRARAGQENP